MDRSQENIYPARGVHGATLARAARLPLIAAVLLAGLALPLARPLPARAAGEFTDIDAGLPGVHYSAVAWGDYDSDGDLDILLSGDAESGYITRIYRNDGGAFADINAGLPGVHAGAVAWGDCDNDGDLDILLAGVTSSSGRITRVYRNDGGIFADINAGLPGVVYGAVAWGDYDNDGDLDILLAGEAGSSYYYIARVYRNNGGSFTDIHAGLPGVGNGSSLAWGDYDNDGDLDILLAGDIGGGAMYLARVYRNDGGTFTDIAAGLPGVGLSSVAWGDYDHDGDLDILLTGYIGSDQRIARVYRNDGGSFTDISAGLPGVLMGSAVWGDYDNDGDLDILLAGWSASGLLSRVYRNDGGSFTDIVAGLQPTHVSQVAWGDYDNDGDLDILLAGYNGAWGFAQVYRNNCGIANAPPAAPTGLQAALAPGGASATLSWLAATDDHTPAGGLSYNLRLGTTPGGSDVMAPMAAGNGWRRLPALGNMQERLTAALDLSWLAGGATVYWSVQAVDSAFQGGPFAGEGQFQIGPTPLAVQAPICERADVAAVIYGAPEGTPVRAWVGGTEQPTLYTAHDAFGRQAVLWTFYPPASTDWTVRVEPQLPPGLAAPRWQYRLVWVEGSPAGLQQGQSGGAVSIRQCSGTVLHFQLVDTGAQ